MRFATHTLNCITLFLLTFLTIVATNSSSMANGLTGWEKDSEYNKLYNPKEKDRLKGTIKKFVSVTPLPGMDPGTAFLLDEGDDEVTLVHLCPEVFAKAKETGLKKGSLVKVKGCWTEIGDEFIFLASKVKKGNHFEFKVRLTSDGTPFWTMSPEQLAKERAKE